MMSNACSAPDSAAVVPHWRTISKRPGFVSRGLGGLFSSTIRAGRRWAPASGPDYAKSDSSVHAVFDDLDDGETPSVAMAAARRPVASPPAATAPRPIRPPRRKVVTHLTAALSAAGHPLPTGPGAVGELLATGGGGDPGWERPGRVHFIVGHQDRDYADPRDMTGVVTATEVDLLLANWPAWPHTVNSVASGTLLHPPGDTEGPQYSAFQDRAGVVASLVRVYGLAATTQMAAAFELSGADHVVAVLLIPGAGTRWRSFLRWWKTLDMDVRQRCTPRRALEGFAGHLGRVATTFSRALTDVELAALLEADSIHPVARTLAAMNQIKGVRLYDDWRAGANDAMSTGAVLTGAGTGQAQSQPQAYRKVCVFEMSVPMIETIETISAASGNPERVTTADSLQKVAARLCRLWRVASWDQLGQATSSPKLRATPDPQAVKDAGRVGRRAAEASTGERKRRPTCSGGSGVAPKPKRGRFLPPPTTAAQKVWIASGGSFTAGVSSSPSPFTTAPSRTLSRILRHDARRRGIFIDPSGFVTVANLLRQPELRSTTLADLRAIVANCPKQRFGLERRRDGEWWIRANQGHSLAGIRAEELCTKITLTTADRYRSVVHGTTRAAWHSIRGSGLHRMQRQHVHFGQGPPSAGSGPGTGVRKSSQVLVHIDLHAALGAGIPFYVSANGVILSPGEGTTGTVPVKYFSKVVDSRTGQTLL